MLSSDFMGCCPIYLTSDYVCIHTLGQGLDPGVLILQSAGVDQLPGNKLSEILRWLARDICHKFTMYTLYIQVYVNMYTYVYIAKESSAFIHSFKQILKSHHFNYQKGFEIYYSGPPKMGANNSWGGGQKHFREGMSPQAPPPQLRAWQFQIYVDLHMAPNPQPPWQSVRLYTGSFTKKYSIQVI